jgi:hypothetical protein
MNIASYAGKITLATIISIGNGEEQDRQLPDGTPKNA